MVCVCRVYAWCRRDQQRASDPMGLWKMANWGPNLGPDQNSWFSVLSLLSSTLPPAANPAARLGSGEKRDTPAVHVLGPHCPCLSVVRAEEVARVIHLLLGRLD